jgi:hypothetical protein
MHPENFIPTLSGSLYVLLAYFVLVLCIDIAAGVVRSMVALWRKNAATALTIKSFDWNYLGSFAKSQLMSPPVMAVAGALALAVISPDGTKQSIYAVASAAAFAQAVILTRDIFTKIREVAALAMFQAAVLPVAK